MKKILLTAVLAIEFMAVHGQVFIPFDKKR